MQNPLLTFEYRIPFDQIRADHVEPAIDALLSDSQNGLDAMVGDVEPRTYDNTMERLDSFSKQLEYAINIVRHLEGVANTPELREAYNAAQPKVAAFFASLPLNDRVWTAIKAYARTDEAAHLERTRGRYLKK